MNAKFKNCIKCNKQVINCHDCERKKINAFKTKFTNKQIKVFIKELKVYNKKLFKKNLRAALNNFNSQSNAYNINNFRESCANKLQRLFNSKEHEQGENSGKYKKEKLNYGAFYQ